MITGAHHLGSDILRKLIGIELDDLGRHDLADGRCEIGITGSVHGAVSGNDHGTAVLLRHFQDFIRHIVGTHKDQKAGAHLDNVLLGFRIIACHNDLVLDIVDRDVFFCDGYNGDTAADVAVGSAVDDPAADRRIDIFRRDILQQLFCLGCIAHGDQGYIIHGEHAHDTILLIHNAAGLLACTVHDLNRLIDSLIGHDRSRLIDLDLGHLDTGVLQEHRLREAKPVQKISGLCSDLAQTAGNRFYTVCPLKKSITDGCHNRVCIRVLMTSYINNILFHFLPH